MKKNLFNSIILGSLLFLLPACSKFTEITPKGSNILSRVSDLDLILNFNYSLNSGIAQNTLEATTTASTAFNAGDAGTLVNDIYPPLTNVANLIATHTITLPYALTVYDETIDRANLTSTDAKYEKMYFIINNVCNVVLAKADAATGDRVKANQLKAEAYILRAYFHYLLVNFYAKAYNPATAATDGGIPYVKENNINEVNIPNKKSTVGEVYANIVADINAGFALNSLPTVPANNMRVGLGFAYGVQAQVLLAMRNYTGALTAANASLAINSTIIDNKLYAPFGSVPFGKPNVTSPDNLFYAAEKGTPLLNGPSLELMSYYEQGDVINDYVKPYYPSVAGAFAITGVTGAKLFYLTTPYAINTAGLTTSDTYLIKAECLARTQNVQGAMDVINAFRKKRIVNSTDLTATTEAQAMAHLMKVFRVEFLYTMKNYFNIKRWNTEDAYKQTITRTVNGVTYRLKPESPLWIFPFPHSGTDYNPYLTQNY